MGYVKTVSGETLELSNVYCPHCGRFFSDPESRMKLTSKCGCEMDDASFQVRWMGETWGPEAEAFKANMNRAYDAYLASKGAMAPRLQKEVEAKKEMEREATLEASRKAAEKGFSAAEQRMAEAFGRDEVFNARRFGFVAVVTRRWSGSGKTETSFRVRWFNSLAAALRWANNPSRSGQPNTFHPVTFKAMEWAGWENCPRYGAVVTFK